MRMRSTLAIQPRVRALATTFATSAAMADASRRVDWTRVLVDLDTVARQGADVLDSSTLLAGRLRDGARTRPPPPRARASELERAGYSRTIGSAFRADDVARRT